MRFLLLIVLLYGTSVWASCPTFTAKQDELIRQAYYTGYIEDMGYTLASIVIVESFAGPYIVRVNGSDGEHGSYGITQIGLTTAMWLEEEDNIWKAKAEIVPLLIKSDTYALALAIRKLKSVRKGVGRGTDWKSLWAYYNGSGSSAREYAKKIERNVGMLQHCFTFH